MSYEDIQTLLKLESREGINDQISCFDYVSAIYSEDELWVVEVFVEPVGEIRVKGKTLKHVLEFWIELFRSQPEGWDFAKAGGHLDKSLKEDLKWTDPKEAKNIWTLGHNT